MPRISAAALGVGSGRRARIPAASPSERGRKGRFSGTLSPAADPGHFRHEDRELLALYCVQVIAARALMKRRRRAAGARARPAGRDGVDHHAVDQIAIGAEVPRRRTIAALPRQACGDRAEAVGPDARKRPEKPEAPVERRRCQSTRAGPQEKPRHDRRGLKGGPLGDFQQTERTASNSYRASLQGATDAPNTAYRKSIPSHRQRGQSAGPSRPAGVFRKGRQRLRDVPIGDGSVGRAIKIAQLQFPHPVTAHTAPKSRRRV